MIAALGVGVAQADLKLKWKQNRSRRKNCASMPQLPYSPSRCSTTPRACGARRCSNR